MQLDLRPMEGRFVALEPLSAEHREGLAGVFLSDAEAWDVDSVEGCGGDFDAWWAEAEAEFVSGRRHLYVVRSLTDAAVLGTVSFFNPRPSAKVVELGAVLLTEAARRSPAQVEAFHLMLSHAFGCGAMRVEFLIDVRAARSRAIVEKLGASREGVLRRHKITAAGHVRDTAMFSIVDLDWPAIQARQQYQLSEAFVPALSRAA
jgi:N-acetyltransferase